MERLTTGDTFCIQKFEALRQAYALSCMNDMYCPLLHTAIFNDCLFECTAASTKAADSVRHGDVPLILEPPLKNPVRKDPSNHICGLQLQAICICLISFICRRGYEKASCALLKSYRGVRAQRSQSLQDAGITADVFPIALLYLAENLKPAPQAIR